MRLGELLVGGGLLTHEQLEQALRAQVMWGGRLGTNLIELGFVELDHLARALSQQHRMPAALGKHFERVDRELQKLLSADVAEKFQCVPLARVGPERSIVLAATGPLAPRALAIIADELVVDPKLLVPSIAAELRIRYHLERAYGIPRDARFLRARGKTIPPFPQFPTTPDAWGDVSEVNVPIPDLREDDAAGGDQSVDVAMDAEAPDDAVAVVATPRTATRSRARSRQPVALVDDAVEELDADALHDDDAAPSIDAARARASAAAAQRVSAPLLVVAEPPVDVIDDAPEPPAGQIEELDDLSGDVVEDEAAAREDDAAGRDRRRYVPTLADSQPIQAITGETSLGRIPIRRVLVSATPAEVAPAAEAPPAQTFATLGEATRAIRRASGRDRVAELVMDTIDRFAPACQGAVFLVLRGEAAIGWKGFARSGEDVPQMAVPVAGEDGTIPPGMIPAVVKKNAVARRASEDLAPVDSRLHATIGTAGEPGDLAVVPITIAGQVMCMIAAATEADAPIDVIESIAAAAAAAFSRLMRDAAR